MNIAGLLAGLAQAFQPIVVLWTFIGTVVGIVFGALPGLTATTAIAIFLPMTFYMPASTSFAFLLGIYCGGYYAGSIPAVLIKTPGAPGNAATVLDGYPMAARGEADRALQISVISSLIGGVISALCLFFFAPAIGRFALRFGPAEYCAVAFLGLVAVAGISGKSLLRGFISVIIGMLLATVGLDSVSGVARFTFGNAKLYQGFSLVPTLIGFFAISEVLVKSEGDTTSAQDVYPVKSMLPNLRPYWESKWLLLKSSIIGTLVGVIPGTGSSIASWLAYNEGKRSSKNRDNFGKGEPEGIMCSESANNAVTGGALIPMLTLGIPGDVTTAILLNALVIQGLVPGPRLISQHYDLISMILFILLMSNLFMTIIGLCGAKLFPQILKIKQTMLLPIIVVLCVTGAFAANNSLFDVKIAAIIGLVAYLMVKFELPIPPAVLGLILGPIIEPNMVRIFTGRNNLSLFVKRPVALVLMILCILFLLYAMKDKFQWKIRKKKNAENE